MRLLPIATALNLLLAPVPLSAATSLPAWLAGTWARESGASWAEALWTPPRHGQMLGISRDGFGPDVTTWAYLRIEQGKDGGLVLMVQNSGGTAIRYPLAVASEAAIEFTNPAESSRQRIRFSREGQLLVIESSRIDGSEAERWNYRPVATQIE